MPGDVDRPPPDFGPVTRRLVDGVFTCSGEETAGLAEAWAAELPEAVWIALHGDLGVGKTTLVSGLAKGFGIAESVTSPTFAILNIYRGNRQLIHVDAYRLKSADEAADLQLDDWIYPPFCIAVEWPEVLGDLLPPATLHLELSIAAPSQHRLQLRHR